MTVLPKEDNIASKKIRKEQLAGLMGDVLMKKLFSLQTTGASNDFEQATQICAMCDRIWYEENLTQQYVRNHMFGAQSPM